MYRTIYMVMVVSDDGDLIARRYAATKHDADRIAGQYKGKLIDIKLMNEREREWIDERDVERVPACRLTKKAINHGLPNVGALRREYRFVGQTGIFKSPVRTYWGAFMDPDGWVTVYAYGDAKAANHYYREGCIDISDLIADWIEGDLKRRDVVAVLHSRARDEF